jgi:SepF-like predicted cell division protein (DUF552 family)
MLNIKIDEENYTQAEQIIEHIITEDFNLIVDIRNVSTTTAVKVWGEVKEVVKKYGPKLCLPNQEVTIITSPDASYKYIVDNNDMMACLRDFGVSCKITFI